jgi:hypothetical protein
MIVPLHMSKNKYVNIHLKLPEDMPSVLRTTRKKSLLKAMPEDMPMNDAEGYEEALRDAGLTKCFSHIAWRPPDKL